MLEARFQPCVPIAAKAVPTGPDWFHEIKYDGYKVSRLTLHKILGAIERVALRIPPRR